MEKVMSEESSMPLISVQLPLFKGNVTSIVNL